MAKQSEAAKNLAALMQQGVIPTGKQGEAQLSLEEQPKGVAGEKLQEILSDHDEKKIIFIPLDFLLDNPYQPRERIEIDDDLREMAEGIDEYKLLGAVPVRRHPEREGYFQLVFGHRRREASRLAGKRTMPCVIEAIDDAGMEIFAALENVQRKDLTDIQLGRYFLRMQKEGYTQEEIAQKIKKKRGYVVNRLRLAEAPSDIQTLVLAKPDSLRAVSYLKNVEDEQDRALLIGYLKTGQLFADDLAGDISVVLATLKAKSVLAEVSDGGAQTTTTNQTAAWSQDQREISTEKEETEQREVQTIASTAEAVYQPEKEDRSQDEARIGAAKLQRICRDLKTYIEKVSKRKDALSQEELRAVQQLGELYTIGLLPYLSPRE